MIFEDCDSLKCLESMVSAPVLKNMQGRYLAVSPKLTYTNHQKCGVTGSKVLSSGILGTSGSCDCHKMIHDRETFHFDALKLPSIKFKRQTANSIQ